MEALISVIVPVFNVEQYIEKCLKSIVMQTWKNLEIILVDDGSTDASGKICDRYAAADNRIHVIHTKNCGVTHARKEGIKLATGRLIGFVDGDDYIDVDYYEKLADKMLSADYDFVQAGTVYEYENGAVYSVMPKEQSYHIEGKQIDILCEGLLGKRQEIDLLANSLWVRLFRADKIKECMAFLPDDFIFGEDMACMCHYLMRTRKFAMIGTTGYHYIQRTTSAMHTRDISFIVKNCKLYDYVVRIFTGTPCYERVKTLMKSYLIREIANVWEGVTGQYLAQYRFPNIQMLSGKAILIYGAGRTGIDYYRQICRHPQCRIVALADSSHEKYHYEDVSVVGIEQVRQLQWDILIIAVLCRETANQIRHYLLENGIEQEKIYWCAPEKIYQPGE